MAKTRKSNTEFEMNTGANESVAKASKKKEMESTEKGVGEVVQLPGGYTKRRSRGNDRKINLSVSAACRWAMPSQRLFKHSRHLPRFGVLGVEDICNGQ